MVTGARGFKGAHLAAILKELGANVFGVVNSRAHPDSAYELLGLGGKIVEIHADISKRHEVFDVVNAIRPEVTFHLAAKALVPVCLRDPHRAFEVNLMGTVNLLEAYRELGIGGRLLITSTDHVFGPVSETEVPFAEDSPLHHGAPYDTSKAVMEMAVRCYHGTFADALPRVCLTRSANAFGPGDTNQRRVLPHFIQSGLRTDVVPMTTRKNGRQFVHVTDVVSGYILAASWLGQVPRSHEVPTFHFAIEVYSGTDEPFVRIQDLARLVADLTHARVEEDEGCVDYMPNENPVQGLSCARAREQLGWRPFRGFEESLEELVEWYRPETTHNRRVDLIRRAVGEAAHRLRGHPLVCGKQCRAAANNPVTEPIEYFQGSCI
jgi:CDP-glucose 4,6-dehydratase